MRNPISAAGALIAVVAIANIIFLVADDILSERHSPYIGILAYVVAPGILCIGLAIFIAGLFVERRRRRRAAPEVIPPYPRLDFNNRRTRTIFAGTVIASFTFVVVSLLGSYQAYHYTDSDDFCGLACHSVMSPEYTAYKASPHARVGCVQCHIGPGATWFVKSKLSGAYQVYATLGNKYPRPIPTPVASLRPAQETCEQCHWPEKFFGAQMKVFNHFGYDEQNTARETRLLINTGGGRPLGGFNHGIHWHMNIANEVTYIATDPHRQQIPWVQMRDRSTGKVVEYLAPDSKLTPEQIAAAPKRRMDCVDCHNRPTHIYVPPDRSVDRALLAGTIDRTIPFIKQQAVDALSKEYPSTAAAIPAIAKQIDDYYRASHAELYALDRQKIEKAILAVQEIYRGSVFPEMKVDWRTHPDNIGHLYYQGCFRCHDDQHASKDGQKISKACDLCHSLVSQTEGSTVMVEAPDSNFTHPVELGDMREFNCTDCHTGGPQG
ncbi:MAG TPA: NapC/NirT family cytochrome c [Thermoanaerobaculia bacterium]